MRNNLFCLIVERSLMSKPRKGTPKNQGGGGGVELRSRCCSDCCNAAPSHCKTFCNLAMQASTAISSSATHLSPCKPDIHI
mmetsp:Transcript_87985/g.153024  ORF Transcript_87985/g.153024 Transcript_87985/m.153024 type:complete len:81 (-) Transcript_87985:394-636(-)